MRSVILGITKIVPQKNAPMNILPYESGGGGGGGAPRLAHPLPFPPPFPTAL